MRRIKGLGGILHAATIFGSLSLVSAPDGQAAEGAASNYFPGAYGDFLVAVAPEPGPVFMNVSLFYSAQVSTAVREGTIKTDLDATAYYNLMMGLHVWDAPALGGRFAVGGYVPLGYSHLDASIGQIAVSDDEFNIGDVGIIPASFYWSRGNFHVNLYEMIIAPTGQYNTNNLVNIGRNYWSFDTIMAMTWFNPDTGTEVTVTPGVMVNTRNSATDYKTGTEFHVDFMVNQFLSEAFAIGLHGYYYSQLSGDSGTGALLGGFKGQSVGLGMALTWIPESAGGKVLVTGKWLHDVHAKNRLNADYGALTIIVTF